MRRRVLHHRREHDAAVPPEVRRGDLQREPGAPHGYKNHGAILAERTMAIHESAAVLRASRQASCAVLAQGVAVLQDERVRADAAPHEAQIQEQLAAEAQNDRAHNRGLGGAVLEGLCWV